MKQIFTLGAKEFRDYFSSPIAYVFIAVFLSLSFWLYFSQIFLYGQNTLRPFFDWLPVLFVVFLPSVTMGKWADEKKTGTLEILLTMPVGDWQLVLGKWFSCLAFLASILCLTLPLPIVFSRLGDLDWGSVVGSYVGIFLLGASYLAFGLFVSSLTKNQIVAFLVTVLALFLFFILGEPIVTSHLPASFVPMLQFLSFNFHFDSLSRGVIDSRDVIYYVSTMGLFLYLNGISLQMRKV
jgi:ABC-2 type transport system permease protein